jgi:hypothetical protein
MRRLEELLDIVLAFALAGMSRNPEALADPLMIA